MARAQSATLVVRGGPLASRRMRPADVLRPPADHVLPFSRRSWLSAVELPDATITPILQVETSAEGIEAVPPESALESYRPYS
jgi:hypothetical protein